MKRFGFILSYSWKNLSRHRKRTLITASAIASGLALYLFMDAWLLGAEMDSQRNLRRYETSSARVYHQDNWEVWERLRLSNLIENPAQVVDTIENLGYTAAPRVSFQADVIVYENPYPTDGSMTIRAYGIDVAADNRVFSLANFVDEGRYPEAGEYGAVIGAGLARTLGAEVGFPLTLVTRTREGYYQTLDLVITGIVNTPNPIVNRANIYIPLEVIDQELQMAGAVTEIIIGISETENTQKAAQRIQAAISQNRPELQTYPWEEIAADFLALAATKSGGSSIMLFLVFIIAAVGISNTMLMAIFERVRELGTLRALGMRNRDIRLMFLLEAGGIGFIGSVVGLVFGSILIAFVTYIGVDFTALLGDMDIGYRINGIMYGTWHPQAMVTAFFVGIFMAALVAYLPTRRALKMGITDCLRDE
ncbi:MAG: FtsX-like permease family protein [Spirochaetales bacterium]|nr:FtsX-like permease family protein [Spirochaetales bacterium]